MSLARATVLARIWRPTQTILPRAKEFSSDNHHHEEPHEYPQEGETTYIARRFLLDVVITGFSSSFWRNTLIGSLLLAAAYKYAPEPGDDVYLTRWIALYTTPRDLWTELASKHTAMSLDLSETKLLLSAARKPLVHRYRYPQ